MFNRSMCLHFIQISTLSLVHDKSDSLKGIVLQWIVGKILDKMRGERGSECESVRERDGY